MNRSLAGMFVLALLALSAGPDPAQAAESYDNCTGFIASIPAAITTQGTWCLKQDLATAITGGVAITIAANNVTLDCNDFKLGGLAAGLGTSMVGISGSGRLNTTIRHCNIRGFLRGINLGGTGGGHTIEDNRFDGNTFEAIRIEGDGSVIRRNRVFDTGGSTASSGDTYAVYALDSTDILDNTVSGVVAAAGSNGSAYAISVLNNPDGSVSGNRVRGLVPAGTGLAYGIYSSSDTRIAFRNNDIAGTSAGFGLVCSDNHSSAQNNLIGGFTTAIVACTDAGGNASIP